ncbi:FimV family protein [Agaribacterium sp. ZY112]|uniref:type IV pilus assembly protein FimV n=1 Tax=Agaribacterium sp. ZY112 TaxID=3233574 RepID=UPI003524CC13
MAQSSSYPFKRVLSLSAAIAAVSYSSLIYAIGLGELSNKGSLGQPLNALIRLQGTDRVEPSNLKFRLLSEEEARRLGVDLIYSSYRIDHRFTMEAGVPVAVQLSSKRRIDEPYLNLLVELKWPGGKVYREYSLLLDAPSAYAPVAEHSASVNPSPQIGGPEPTGRPKSSVQRYERSAYNAPSALGVNSGAAKASSVSGAEYVVQAGDSLSGIVARMQPPAGMSRAQLQRQLHQNNPSAFVRGNINSLMAGATLILPESSVWSSEASLNASAAQNQAQADRARLRLSDPSDAKAQVNTGPSKQQIRDEIDSTQEMLDLLVKENSELRARIEKIEKSNYINTLSEIVKVQQEQIKALKTGRVMASETLESDPRLKLAAGELSAAALSLANSAQAATSDVQAQPNTLRPWFERHFFWLLGAAAIGVGLVAGVLMMLFMRRKDPVYSASEFADEEIGSDLTISDEEFVADSGNVHCFTEAMNQRSSQQVDLGVESSAELDVEQEREDEVNELLSMAKIYCRAGKFSEAKSILSSVTEEQDPRLQMALNELENIERARRAD